MATVKNDTIATPSVTQLQSSLSSLTTATHILDGFAHRNKNQHRGTRWWGPFAMLRRNLHKILPDLEGAVQRAEVLSSSSVAVPSSKRRKTADGGGKALKRPELDRVLERATWVRDAVSVRAYEAFTQLTADRQFAQLGLVLIGVLAQVQEAIRPFVREQPELEPEPEPGDGVQPAEAAHDVEARGEAVSRVVAPPAGGGAGEYDLGVVVPRDHLGEGGHVGGVQLSVEHDSPPVPHRPSTKDEHSAQKFETKKREMLKEEDGLSRTAEESGTRSAELKEVKKVKKKKKRRRKGGDEFDDLFSSLL